MLFVTLSKDLSFVNYFTARYTLIFIAGFHKFWEIITLEQIFELFRVFLYTLYFVARCSVFSDKDGNVLVL